MNEGMGSFIENYIHCLIGVTIIAIVILLIRRFVGYRLTKRFTYGMWIIIPVFMLAAPFVNLPMPHFVGDVIAPVNEKLDTVLGQSKEETDLYYVQKEESTELPKAQSIKLSTEISAKQSTEQQMKSPNVNPIMVERALKENIIRVIVCGYFAVSTLFFLVIFLANFRFAVKCRRKRKYLCKSMGIGLPVYKLEGISSPFLMGRNIYLPVDMEEGELKYAILHEECHFKHGDAIWVAVRYLIFGIYFYNPIIWMAFKYSGHDCELACDEEVMRSIQETERKAYGGCLLNAIEKRMRVSDRVLLSTNMKSNKILMKERIENIAIKRKKSHMVMLLTAVMLGTITSCMLVEDVEAKMEDAEAKAEELTETKEPTQTIDNVSDIVEHGDVVQVCSEIWTRPVWEKEETYTIMENGRELELVVDEARTEFLGKSVGDVVLVTEEKTGIEYSYYYTILGINNESVPAYSIPSDWDYQLVPGKVANFLMENGEEADTGYLYGFEERLKDNGSTWWYGVTKFYTNAEASSTLEPQGEFAYSPTNITIPTKTCTWSEGVSGDGIGEYVEIRQLYMGPGDEVLTFNQLCIVNGYAENEEKWQENNRVKSLKFYYEDEYMGTILLEDSIQPQYIDLTPLQMTVDNGREAEFRFEIAEVYEGSKYDDTCITGIEIGFDGRYAD